MKKIIYSIIFLLFSISSIFAKDIDTKELSPFSVYKDMYWIFGLSKDQTRLQISFKYSLAEKYNTGIFLGYSQYAVWPLYNPSSPFDDINFSPEVFIKSKYFLTNYIDYIQVSPFQHMSNGKDKHDSRSINRCYSEIQKTFYHGIFNPGINLKLFVYYNQENVEYVKYTKCYELKLYMKYGKSKEMNDKGEIYATLSGLKKGFQEVGMISERIPTTNIRMYIQFYHGYLESQLYYDENVNRIRLGILFR